MKIKIGKTCFSLELVIILILSILIYSVYFIKTANFPLFSIIFFLVIFGGSFKSKFLKENLFIFLFIAIFSITKVWLAIGCLILLFIPVSFLIYKGSNPVLKILLSFSLLTSISIILVVLDYIAIPITTLTIFLSILFFPLVSFFLLKPKKFKDSYKLINNIHFNNTNRYKKHIMFLILFLVLLLIWSPLLQERNIGRSMASVYVERILFIEEGMDRYKDIPDWNPKLELGHAPWIFDSIYYYLNNVLINRISFKGNIINTFNFYYFVIIFFIALAIAELCYTVSKGSQLLSIIFALIFVSTSQFVAFATFISYSKMFSALPIILTALIFIWKSTINKDSFYWKPIAITAGFAIILHPLLGVGFIIFISIFILISILLSLTKKEARNIKDIIRLLIKSFFPLIIAIVIASIWLIPNLEYHNYSPPKPQENIKEFHELFVGTSYELTNYFKDILSDARGKVSYGFHREVTIFFFSIFICYILVYLLQFKKISMESKKKQKIMLIVFLTFIINISLIMFLNNFQYFKKTLEFWRPTIIFASLFIILLGYLSIIRTSNLVNKFSNVARVFKIIIVIISILLLLFVLVDTQPKITEYYSESFISRMPESEPAKIISSLPLNGRITTYGLYATVVEPVTAQLTNHYFTGGGGFNLMQTKDVYYKKIHDHDFGLSEEFFQQNKTRDYLINIFTQIGGRYFWVNACHPYGAMFLKEIEYNTTLKIIDVSSDKCNAIMELPEVYLAGKVKVFNKNKDFDEISFYNNPKNRYVYLLDETLVGLENYDKIRIDKKKLSEEPLSFNQKSFTYFEISGNFTKGEWVIFKQQYHPRWKAYQNNKRIDIVMTNLGLMAIKTTEQSDKITLKYNVSILDKFSAITSLSVILIILLIKPIKSVSDKKEINKNSTKESLEESNNGKIN